jgi:hypothetical protein
MYGTSRGIDTAACGQPSTMVHILRVLLLQQVIVPVGHVSRNMLKSLSNGNMKSPEY